VVVSSPAPPNPIIVPVVKGLDAHISGLDPEAEQRVGGHVGLFATATYRLARQPAVVVAIDNLLDTFYYEKLGFPLQGVSFELSDRLGF
jgi:hypothetical protein